MAVQWLGFCTFAAEDAGSILGRGTKILQASDRFWAVMNWRFYTLNVLGRWLLCLTNLTEIHEGLVTKTNKPQINHK